MSRPATAADLAVDLVDEPPLAVAELLPTPCPTCGGEGEVYTVIVLHGGRIWPRLDRCPTCGGSGEAS